MLINNVRFLRKINIIDCLMLNRLIRFTIPIEILCVIRYMGVIVAIIIEE